MAVVRPMVYKKRLAGGNKISICFVWMASFLIPLHHIIKNVVLQWPTEDAVVCKTTECHQADAYGLIAAAYIVPHLVIIALYMGIAVKLYKRRVPGDQSSSSDHQNQNARETATRVTRMIIFIIIAFDVCWAPVFFLYIGESLSESFSEFADFKGSKISKIFMISNGICNAVIYAIFNATFRRAFKDALYNKKLAFAWNRVHSTFHARSSPSVSTQEAQIH